MANWRLGAGSATTLLIMNDGYGVMRGIQDKYLMPAITTSCTHAGLYLLAQAIGLQAWSVER